MDTKKYIGILFLALALISCKKDKVDNTPESLLTKYHWYLSKQIDTFFSRNPDTLYDVDVYQVDSCEQASYYRFYADGKVDRYFPCYTSPRMVSGTWELFPDSLFYVSLPYLAGNFGFGPAKLISIDHTEFKTNSKSPFSIHSSSAPPVYGIRSATMFFRRK